MRIFACLMIPLALLAAGCGDTIHDTAMQGPVDSDLYHEAVETNQQRIAGEDHPLPTSIVMTPFQMIAAGYDDVIVGPIESLWNYMNHDTLSSARIEMFDAKSADRRREGILKRVNFRIARGGPNILAYAQLANDVDYTVRAAAIRALNRSRAKGQTAVFLKGLNDDKDLVRAESAKALANIPDNAAVPQLIFRLNEDIDQDVRIACADALRNYKTIQVANALVGVLSDKEFSVAWQARQSLELLTGQDFRYDENAWLSYLSSGNKVFG